MMAYKHPLTSFLPSKNYHLPFTFHRRPVVCLSNFSSLTLSKAFPMSLDLQFLDSDEETNDDEKSWRAALMAIRMQCKLPVIDWNELRKLIYTRTKRHAQIEHSLRRQQCRSFPE